MSQENIRLSIRDIFHMLDNKHLLFVMYSDRLIKQFKAALSREDLPQDIKEMLSDHIDSFRMLSTTGHQADTLLNETKPIIYEKLNPDEGYFDGNAIKKKLDEPGPHFKGPEWKNVA
jgi:hypothetical protein